MILGVVDGHIARRSTPQVELLDVPYPDLGTALGMGVDADALASAPVLRRCDEHDVSPGPLAGPSSAVWAVGLAYRDHAFEAGVALATEDALGLPAVFLKASSSLSGAGRPIVLPRLAPAEVDYEGEIAVVIGKEARDIDAADGWDHVFGLTAANDVSARDVQRGIFLGCVQDPSKAKSFDGFTPLGPWLVTPDEFDDRDAVALQTRVNGERRQEATTADLIWPVPDIVAAVSRFATLRPGDVVLTGTPAGVGMASGRFLADGDEVCVEVEIVGELRNRVTDPRPALAIDAVRHRGD